MERQPLSPSADQLHELEEQNRRLEEQLSQLRQEHQEALKASEHRQDMEAHYQQTQLRFQTVFEQSLLGNKILTSYLLIRQANSALVALLGYSQKEDIIGTRILDYAHPDYKLHWQWLQERLWGQRIPHIKLETCLLRKDGATIWVRVNSILIEDSGDLLGYTTLEDITVRKKLEEENQRLYEAQEAMVHTVAHDLKNPIHIIATLSTLLRGEVEQGMAPERQEKCFSYLTMVEDSCQNAYAILKDLLLIGELETNERLPMKNINLKTFLQKELITAQVLARSKEIHIEFECALEALFAPVHPQKMMRALENLLSNAVKFSQPEGLITVALSKQEEKARLTVQDRGIGIEPSWQSSVFDRFTKANRKGTLGEETTGLGLFLVKRIIQLHQGRIWLESQPAQGTTFYIELPLAT